MRLKVLKARDQCRAEAAALLESQVAQVARGLILDAPVGRSEKLLAEVVASDPKRGLVARVAVAGMEHHGSGAFRSEVAVAALNVGKTMLLKMFDECRYRLATFSAASAGK